MIADRQQLVEDTKAFVESVGKLRAAGLNQGDLGDLIGTFQQDRSAGARLASDLLDAGSSVIADLNRTQSALQDAAQAAGVAFGDTMYGSQVDAAKKVADAWEAEKAGLADTAWQVGQAMQADLLRGLGLSDGSFGAKTTTLLQQIRAQWLASLGITGASATPRSAAQAPVVRMPDTLVIVDTDRQLIGRMRVEASNAAAQQSAAVATRSRWV